MIHCSLVNFITEILKYKDHNRNRRNVYYHLTYVMGHIILGILNYILHSPMNDAESTLDRLLFYNIRRRTLLQ